jgi:hypothetical protein
MPDNVQPRSLPDFCAAVVDRHASAWPPTEDQLARDFLAHFGIAGLAHYDGLVKWCDEVGITFSTADLPHDVRGFNYWHENTLSIVMPINGGCFISREHTLFHEVRELLEHNFSGLGRSTAGGDVLESRAEHFAACVRMAIFVESSKDFFKLASEVRNPIGRACAYGVVGVLTVAAVMGCAGIRQLEAQFEAQPSSQAT